MMADQRGRVRFRGVRANAAFVAGAMVAVALVVVSVGLVALTRSQLTGGVESLVITRAQDLAALVSSGEVPARLASSGGSSAQIIDAEGRVLASTGDIEGQGPISLETVAPSRLTTSRVASLEPGEGEHDDEGPYIIALAPADYSGEALTVVVAGSLASVDTTTAALVPLLLAGVPLLVVVAVAATWLVVGRTLAPVNAMATEADQISGSDLQRRIPVPTARDEVRLLGETLNRMLDRLDASAARQRRFVSDASHELKSPVSAILAMAEVAAANPGTVDVEALSQDVGIEATRLALLVDDLLVLALGDEGEMRLDVTLFDLTSLLAEETVRQPYRRASLRLRVPPSLMVTADRRRLGQVVRNLVDNAYRYAGSTVEVSAIETGDEFEILVSDDGPGVPADQRDRIFERFVRLETSRARTEGGTGLGLAVARQIVEAHHGSIDVISDVGSTGAIFRVRIPKRCSAG